MIDLHLHLDGSLDPADMTELARLSKATLPVTNTDEIQKLMMVEPGCTNLGEYLEKFDLPIQVLQTKESFEYAVYRLILRLRSQGLCYAEIRFAPQFHMRLGLTQREVVEAAVAGLQKGTKESGMPAQLILCCMRGEQNHAENVTTVEIAEEFLKKGVCAVDLAGNEATYPTEEFADLFDMARERKIPVTIHAGEAAGAESVQQAIEAGALRIGHGTHAIEDVQLFEKLRERRIPLELCYTSNLQTRAVDIPENYPIKTFLDNGIVVTVNTDNMTVSGTNLKKEYQLLEKQFALKTDELQVFAENAAEAAFLSEEEKNRLKEQIKCSFVSWLEN